MLFSVYFKRLISYGEKGQESIGRFYARWLIYGENIRQVGRAQYLHRNSHPLHCVETRTRPSQLTASRILLPLFPLVFLLVCSAASASCVRLILLFAGRIRALFTYNLALRIFTLLNVM